MNAFSSLRNEVSDSLNLLSVSMGTGQQTVDAYLMDVRQSHGDCFEGIHAVCLLAQTDAAAGPVC